MPKSVEMPESVDVSVCIISFNQEKYIERCLIGVLNQSFSGCIEIIVSDDASDDDTRKLIDRYAEGNPRIVRNYQAKNIGFQKNIRSALQVCRGRFVAFCEADDYWTDPNKIASQFSMMSSDENITIHFGASMDVKEDGTFIRERRSFSSSRYVPLSDVIRRGGGLMPTFTMMLRREAIMKIIDLIMDCPVLDYPIQILVANEGRAYYQNDIFGAYRRMSNGSWSQKMIDNEYYNKYYLRRLDMFIFMINAVGPSSRADFRFSYIREAFYYYIGGRTSFFRKSRTAWAETALLGPGTSVLLLAISLPGVRHVANILFNGYQSLKRWRNPR